MISASKNGHYDIVVQLIAAKVDIDAKDAYKETALHMGFYFDEFNIIPSKSLCFYCFMKHAKMDISKLLKY